MPLENRAFSDSSARGSESLAVSADAMFLQEWQVATFRGLYLVFLGPNTEASPWVGSIFPMRVDMPSSERQRDRLAARLHAAFEDTSLEDGMSHPAEEIIGEVLRSLTEKDARIWLRAFILDSTRPCFAASVLRCLGRQEQPGTAAWRAKLVRDALTMDDLEIRDAAVQAAELWGGSDMRRVLELHSESVGWLRDYIQGVIGDLENG